MPLWVPEAGATGGMLDVPIGRARLAGLTFRPMIETIRDTLQWHRKRPAGMRGRRGWRRRARPRSSRSGRWNRSRGNRPLAGASASEREVEVHDRGAAVALGIDRLQANDEELALRLEQLEQAVDAVVVAQPRQLELRARALSRRRWDSKISRWADWAASASRVSRNATPIACT